MGVHRGTPPPGSASPRCAAGRMNVAGWVVGALDPDDAEFFADHLLTCKDCQLAVAELEPAGQLLGMRPPASLGATTLARIRQAASQR